MVDQNRAYWFKKRGIYYFTRRIPSDLKDLYKVERLTYSIRTKCSKLANTQVKDTLRKLEQYWAQAKGSAEAHPFAAARGRRAQTCPAIFFVCESDVIDNPAHDGFVMRSLFFLTRPLFLLKRQLHRAPSR